MGMNFRDRRNNGRNFGNKINDRTRKDIEEKRNIVSELWEELNEAFMKGTYIFIEKLNGDEIERLKEVVEFDSTKLN